MGNNRGQTTVVLLEATVNRGLSPIRYCGMKRRYAFRRRAQQLVGRDKQLSPNVKVMFLAELTKAFRVCFHVKISTTDKIVLLF